MRTWSALKTLARAAVAVALMLSTIRGTVAWAASETVEDLISKGVELRRQGQHERALELFRRAHAEEPSPRTLAQMGLAEQSLKRWIESEGHLVTALEDASHPWIRKNRAHLQNALEAVRSHIGHLSVQGTPGATVYVQGESRGSLPLAPIRLGEGDVSVQVTAAGRQTLVRTVTIRPGEVVAVDARLEPAIFAPEKTRAVPAEPAAPVRPQGKGDEAPRSQWNSGRVAGATLIGAGVVAIGVGATLLLIDKHETCEMPAPDAMCPQRKQTRIPGWTLIGAGVAVGALGGILVYSFSTSNAQVAVSASPSSVFVSGRF